MKFYPNSIEPAQCRLCQRPIYWARTYPNRKRVPLDRPATSKNLEHDAEGDPVAELTSTTHFATCPQYQTRQAEKPPPLTQARLF